MLSFLVHFIHAFLAVALVTGLVLALWRPLRGPGAVRPVLIAVAAGLVAGGILYAVATRQGVATSARAYLYGTALLATLANAALWPLSGRRSPAGSGSWWCGLLHLATLAAAGIFSFLGYAAEQALSATTVLNTDLILNIAGIALGAVFCLAITPVGEHLGGKVDRRVVYGVMLTASILLVLQWSGEILLALMRLELVELTSLRLSYVAKLGKYACLVPYVLVLLLALLTAITFARRPVLPAGELAQMPKALRRKAKSAVRLETRWAAGGAGTVVGILALLLFFDLYASRPPRISPPVELTPDTAGTIKVPLAEVSDGNLHRYSFVTDDGHVVRFFLINRSRGQGSRIGVVYDACMMCGDMGYIQEKNEIICLACNVRIFVPSIGKAGGCNPIPLAHKVEGDQVVIAAADLDKGARYFSQTVSRKVKDPVTGKTLDNGRAPYQYEYKGRTYFFESEGSAEQFKKSPERYIGNQQSRYLRVQGFQES